MTDTTQTPPDPARIVKLGKLGEKTFDLWATEADLVVNTSNEDEAGWDFVVEQPAHSATPEIPSAPVHTETFSFRGRVQLKSTDKSGGGIDVKLSNWLRMVEDPQPSYFVVLEFDGQDAPQRAFVIHLGEGLIRHSLQRWHENAVGEQRPLNKICMRLSYRPHHQLDTLGGVPLLEELLELMKEGGETWAAYAKWKAQLVHSAGFEAGNVRVKVQIPRRPDLPEDPEALLADLETGLLDALPIERADIFRTRFGITDSTPFLTEEKGILQFVGNPTDFEVEVTAKAAGTSKRTRFRALLRPPRRLAEAIGKNEDLSRYKVRMIAPHVEIVADFGSGNGIFHSVTPQPSEQVSASTIKLHADLASIVAAAQTRDTAIEMSVTHGSDLIIQFFIDPEQPAAFGDAEMASQVLGQYVKLCRDFDVLDEAKITFGEIEADQGALTEMCAYSDPSVNLTDITFSLVPSDEGRDRILKLEGRRIAALSPWSFTFGSHTFVVVIAAWGTLERVSEIDGVIEYRVVCDNIMRIARYARMGPFAEIPIWDLINDAGHDVKRIEDPGEYLVLGPRMMPGAPAELPDRER